MALVVETGAGLANSNSFASVAQGDAYADSRLYKTAWQEAVLPDKEKALITATAAISRDFVFDGVPTSESQALVFPRDGLYTTDGILIADNAMPLILIDATCELANAFLEKNREAEATSRGIKEEEKSVASGMFKRTVYDPIDRVHVSTDVVARMLARLGGVSREGSLNADVTRVY